jgi:hypothetical protein
LSIFGLSQSGFSRSLKFDHRNHNFGDVIRGEILSWQVNFENTGKKDVRIQGVYSGCGCTAVELEKDKIYRPGQKGSILVKFDTTNFIGKVSKQVIVISNEKRRSQTNLNVKANIREEFAIKPVLLDFGLVDSKNDEVRKFEISPVGKFQLDVKDFEFNSDLFELESEKKGNSWHVSLKLRKGVGSGFIKETVYVETNSEVLPKVKIPVRVEVENLIEYSPSYLEFGVIDKKKSKSKSISLTSPEAFSLKPSSIDLIINNQVVKNADEIIIISPSEGESKKKKIEIKLNNAMELSGSVHGRVTLESNLDIHRNVVVDFYAFFK